MATRSIKLKLLLKGRDQAETDQRRQAIWATHEFVNLAAERYAELLLEMRQADVCTGIDAAGNDVKVPASEWQAKLRARLVANGVAESAQAGVLPLLQKLYGEIIPSYHKKGAGDAQIANAFASSLVDNSSLGGEAKAAKGNALAPLMAVRDQPTANWAQQAQALVAANHGALIGAPGGKKAWVMAWLEDRNGELWLDRLKKELDRLAKEASEGTGSVLPAVRKLGALPLMPPVGAGIIASSGALTKHERAGLANAAAALNAWESKRFDMQDNRDKVDARVKAWDDEFGKTHADALSAIRAFEQQEGDYLRTVSLADERTDYQIGPRELRKGWTLLREWLTKHAKASAADREAKVRALQTDLVREFGSHRLLSWLAAPAQQWLADHVEGDVVQRIAVRNVRARKLDKARILPIWTGADAVFHPRFVGFDPPANTNAPGFELRQGHDGRLILELSLLAKQPSGLLSAKDFAFSLVASRQVERPTLKNTRNAKGKTDQALTWRDQSGTAQTGGHVGGSALLLRRKDMEHRDLATLRGGNFGPAWFKLSVEMASDEQKADFKAAFKVAGWLNAGVAKRADKEAKNAPPAPGTRVLAVDLGLRTAVSLSVWRIVSATEPADLGRKVPEWRVSLGQGLAAVHERSTQLALPGEEVDAAVQVRRRVASLEVRELLAAISHMGNLSKACKLDTGQGRQEQLDHLGEAEDPLRAKAKVRISAAELAELGKHVASDQQSWRSAVEAAWQRIDGEMAVELWAWRKAAREATDARRKASFAPDQDAPVDGLLGGKSAWQIEHLELVRKVLVRWHMRQRPQDTKLRRLGFKEQGKFAGNLLDHLTRLKEDRVKTTAALIVSAARGLVRELPTGPKGRDHDRETWLHRFPPAGFIVLEDLSRYRFKTDRPRAENRQLMQWAHREVLNQVKMQAEVLGIHVADTGAAFSSKFDARTGAPGVRCTVVDRGLLARMKSGEAPWLVKLLEEHKVNATAVRVGQILPTGSGEQFVSMDAAGNLRVRHADVNAAQGLALRALTGHATVFRLSARRVPLADGGHVYLTAKTLAARLSGAIQHLCALAVPAQVAALTPRGAAWHTLSAFANARDAARAIGLDLAEVKAVAGGSVDEEAEGADDDAELAQLLADADPDFVTFFRDPSGVIHHGHWVEAKAFWGEFNRRVVAALKAEGKFGPAPAPQPKVFIGADATDDFVL